MTMQMDVTYLQHHINVPTTGIIDAMTLKYAKGLLHNFRHYISPRYQKELEHASDERLIIAAMQVMFRQSNIDPGAIDGYYGPQTDFAYETWREQWTHKAEPTPDSRWREIAEHSNDLFDTLPSQWPTQAEVRTEREAYYGHPGSNLERLQLPYRMRLAWNKEQEINSFACHAKVLLSLKTIFEGIADTYSHDEIIHHGLDLFGGCFNVRKSRGGSQLSMHAWGIAVDFDPMRNRLRWNRKQAYLARPEMKPFWKIVESEGWIGLGPARDFDWMHIQAARL